MNEHKYHLRHAREILRGEGYTATAGGVAAAADAFDALLAAAKALFAADHHDHFAVRMSDSEMAAIEQLRASLALAEPSGECREERR